LLALIVRSAGGAKIFGILRAPHKGGVGEAGGQGRLAGASRPWRNKERRQK